MIPTRLMRPSTAVIVKSSWNIHRPKKAPKRHKLLSIRVRKASETFLKWNSRKTNSTVTAARKVSSISGATSSFMEESPPYSMVMPSGSSGSSSVRMKCLIFFIAAGWLFPLRISADTVTEGMPSLLSSSESFQSGSRLATWRSGTLTPGTVVATILSPIDSYGESGSLPVL